MTTTTNATTCPVCNSTLQHPEADCQPCQGAQRGGWEPEPLMRFEPPAEVSPIAWQGLRFRLRDCGTYYTKPFQLEELQPGSCYWKPVSTFTDRDSAWRYLQSIR